MNKKLVAAVAIILFIVIALAAIAGTFLVTAPPTNEITYKVPASAVKASLGKTATSKTISLRLNSINDPSNPATRAAWSNLFQNKTHLYNMSLTPSSPDDRYLIANITVKNAQPKSVHFSYAALVLLTSNNTAYYANYAVCNSNCSAQALKNQTLNAGFSNDMYVLFSVPAGIHAQRIVYTTSKPVIVMSTA